MSDDLLIQAMEDIGIPDVQILAVIKRAAQIKREKNRDGNARRQREFKARRRDNVDNAITPVTRDYVTEASTPARIDNHASAPVCPVGEPNGSPPVSLFPPEEDKSSSSLQHSAAGKRRRKPLAALADELEAEFSQLLAAYPPRRQGDSMQDARKSFAKARKTSSLEAILAGAKAYARLRQGEDRQYTKGLAAWLNKAQWRDDFGVVTAKTSAVGDGERIDIGGGRAPLKSGVVAAIEGWKKNPMAWPQNAFGAPPDSPACQIPATILRECGVVSQAA